MTCYYAFDFDFCEGNSKTVLCSLHREQTGERVQQPQQKSPSVQNVREYKKLNLAADIWPFMHTIVNVHISGETLL